MPVKILIAEDDLQLRSALQEKLHLEGFETALAIDGVECLKLGATFQPNIILLDLLMPNKDGFEVLYELMSQAWAKEIPIITLTNLADFSSQMKAFSRGSDTYLIKADTSLEKLVTVIKSKLTTLAV